MTGYQAIGAALLTRELGRRPTLQLVLVVAGSLCAGAMAGAADGGSLGASGIPGVSAVSSLGSAMMALILVLTVVRAMARIPEDCTAGWLVPWVCAGGVPAIYPVLLLASVLVVMFAIMLAVVLSFGVGHVLVGGGAQPLRQGPEVLAVGAMALATFACAGLLAGLFGRTLTRAFGVLGLAVGIPIVVVAIAARWAESLPGWFFRAVWIHLPPSTDGPLGRVALQGAVYILVAVAVAVMMAPRVIGRER